MLSACGGEKPRQDEGAVSGEFPVEVTTSKFPNRQRLAEKTDLVLEVENTGDETIPELAVTISTDNGAVNGVGTDAAAAGSFSIRVDNPRLANPNRPVWILENKFPRVRGQPAPAGSSPGTVAQTNTFGFGELPAGESRELIWRVTPVMTGTYTVNYEIAADLYGEATAVTDDGSTPEGKFVVTITDRPPEASVGEGGEVEIEE